MSIHFRGNILDDKIRMWNISAIECYQLIEVKNNKTTKSTVQAKKNISVAKYGQKAANL